MSYKFRLLLFLVVLTGCSNNHPKAGNDAPASINKAWKFVKIDTARSSFGRFGSVWFRNNTLDLSNKDTLRFFYKNDKTAPTSYPYKIMHDTIFVQNRASYKILKLTGEELDLVNIFKNSSDNKRSNPSIVMIYEAGN